MIDINEQFETSTMTDVEFAALETFAEAGLDLFYLKDVHDELRDAGHWLVQLQYCTTKCLCKTFLI